MCTGLMLKGPARLEGPFSMEIKIEAIADANPHKNKTGQYAPSYPF